MLWYGGSVAEAVTLSKQRNSVFVVFIEGDNDLSKEMVETLSHTDISSRLSDERNFLVIKLESGSTNYVHFAQFYQFVPVPSLFFIGQNGTPLEVVCAGVTPENLGLRIDRILEEHRKGSDLIQPSTSAQHVTPAPAAPAAPAEQAKPEPPPPRYETVCTGDVCERRPVQQQTSEPVATEAACTQAERASQAEATAQAERAAEEEARQKLERVKELLEAKRKQKEEQERELEKEKELSRRSAGRGAAGLRRWQEEEEYKNIQEERKRDKLESSLARQRVLEQIARDRAEQRARTAPAPAPAPVDTAPVDPAPVDGDALEDEPTSGDAPRERQARIQFKLADGGTHCARFPAAAPLAAVRRYVADNVQRSSDFTLWLSFPRRELTEAAASLDALRLTPSATVLVVASGPVQRLSYADALRELLAAMLRPVKGVYDWLYARLVGPAPRSGSPPPPPAPPARPRARGNVRRLHEDRSDDDTNTWNGNSTQQM